MLLLLGVIYMLRLWSIVVVLILVSLKVLLMVWVNSWSFVWIVIVSLVVDVVEVFILIKLARVGAITFVIALVWVLLILIWLLPRSWASLEGLLVGKIFDVLRHDYEWLGENLLVLRKGILILDWNDILLRQLLWHRSEWSAVSIEEWRWRLNWNHNWLWWFFHLRKYFFLFNDFRFVKLVLSFIKS